MGSDDKNSSFFDENPDFAENFYKNIDRVLSDIEYDVEYSKEPTSEKEISDEPKDEPKDELIDTKESNIPELEEVAVTDLNSSDQISNEKDNDTTKKKNELDSIKEDTTNVNEDGDGHNRKDNIIEAADDEMKEDNQSDRSLQDEEVASLEPASASDMDATKEFTIIDMQDSKDEANDSETTVDDQIDEALTDINASLAKQITDELQAIESTQPKKKKFHWAKLRNSLLIGLGVFLLLGLFLSFTKPGNRILKAMGGKIWTLTTNDFDKSGPMLPDVDDVDNENQDLPEVNPKDILWNVRSGSGRHEDHVFNILLLGEEAIASNGARGRTDLIVIATMNKKDKKVKLTSLMRDTLVQIPGYQDNKLNSAYEKGGIDLLYQTIELNFDIRLDGCVMVNFENFEKVIDRLDGLDITLTRGEAKYLNSTNYISKPQYRNVTEGLQRLNGNQVLGYSRIRHRAAITGDNNDYGRTDRHRIILNAIFDKYKTKSKPELATIMIGVLPMITTDINSKGFEVLLDTFMEIGITDIEQMRIPVDGAFREHVKVRGMEVLIPDLQANVEALHKFIFEE